MDMLSQNPIPAEVYSHKYNAYGYGYPTYETQVQPKTTEQETKYWNQINTGFHQEYSTHSPTQIIPSIPQYSASDNTSLITVSLDQQELWEQFHNVGTEMILTKSGRRMFPGCRIRLSGLKPTSKYCVLMSVARNDSYRYRFQNGEWTAAGPGEVEFAPRYFVHQDSPATGAKLMKGLISFHKAKLSNSNAASNYVNGKLIMHSMHKYHVCIHIIESEDPANLESMQTFPLPVTSFITVTAYQNTELTKLKIANNPFAKGFREDGARGIKTARTQFQQDPFQIPEYSSAKRLRPEFPQNAAITSHISNVPCTGTAEYMTQSQSYNSLTYPTDDLARAAYASAVVPSGTGYLSSNSYIYPNYATDTPTRMQNPEFTQQYTPVGATQAEDNVGQTYGVDHAQQYSQQVDVSAAYQYTYPTASYSTLPALPTEAQQQYLPPQATENFWQSVEHTPYMPTISPIQANEYVPISQQSNQVDECSDENTPEFLYKPYSDEGYSSPINDNLVQAS